jgi:hypothetical protein
VARALALPLTVAAVAMMWTSPVGAAEPQSETAVYAIGKCFDLAMPPPQRPTRFDYNCDGTGVLQDMMWTTWGVDGAKGTGTDSSIECKPNCAQGTRLTNPVVVHAWNPLAPNSALCPSGVRFYSDLSIAYPEGAPPWIKPGTTWDEGTDFVTIDGMPAVHFSELKPNCRPR